MQTDYAGQTVPVIDPGTGVIHAAQIFVAVLGASNPTFASSGQKLPDWIDGQVRALSLFGGVTRAIVCDNLKAGVVKALWFEPTLANYHHNQVAKETFRNRRASHLEVPLAVGACRRHSDKRRRWVKYRYFAREGTPDWVFRAAVKDRAGKHHVPEVRRRSAARPEAPQCVD
jgi:transposase